MKLLGYKSYVDQLHSEFPLVDKKSVEAVLKHGTNTMLSYKVQDIDLFIRDDKNLKFYMYAGDVTKDPYKRNGIYFKKKRKKLRHMYSLDKVEYGGYYYFGLNEDEWQLFIESKTLIKAYYYKILEECYIKPNTAHIFRVKMDNQKKWCIIQENYEECNAEYLLRRNGKGFEPINNSK
jgi:hypothetical protein